MPMRIVLTLSAAAILSLCCLLIWYLKPESKTIPNLQNTSFDMPVSHVPATMLEENESEQTVTALSHLEEQRDALYAEFGQLSFEMIEGQKPDLRHVSQLLKDHQTLVNAGAISHEDAQNYLEFLKRVFPEMESELNFYLIELAKSHVDPP